MQEQQIAEIKEAMRQLMAFIQERQGNLTEPEQTAIAQALDHAASRITQLRQEQQAEAQQSQEGAATPQQIPPLNPTDSPSSNINAMQFDPETNELFIKFQDKYPGTNGPIYSYKNVPPYIFNIIRRGSIAPKTSGRNAWHTWKEGVTPSHGAAVNALLKEGGFEFQRVG